MTLLSIIIANYNNGHLLKNCVQSILHSSPREEIEILIVDDCSTDNSLACLKTLTAHPFIRFYQHTENRGVDAVVNTAVPLAKGEYLHLFAADDLYLPKALNTMLDLIKHNPHIPIFCSDYASFSTSSQSIVQLLPLTSFYTFTPSETYRLFRHTGFWIPGHTVFVKKSAYIPFMPQDKQLGPISDWYIYHQMTLANGVGYYPGALIARREDPFSYSSSLSYKDLRSMWLYLLSLLSKEPNSLLGRSGICRMLGLKSIYKDLVMTPRFWKYLLPMLLKEFEKIFFQTMKLDRDKFWLNRLKRVSEKTY